MPESNKENYQTNQQLVTFNDGDKIKVMNSMSHPLSTKMIKRNFDINSTGNLNATSADVLNDVDSQA